MTKRQEPHHGFPMTLKKSNRRGAKASLMPMSQLTRPRKPDSAGNIAMAERAENGEKQLTC
jgi:hypothetical protein